MIYIVAALFVVTLLIVRPLAGRKLTRREAAVLFIIYLCTGLAVRAVLFAFGM